MEAVIGIVIGICPEYLGLTLNDEQMTDIWQRNYGVPGKEQYTAAIDLLQIKVITAYLFFYFATFFYYYIFLSF